MLVAVIGKGGVGKTSITAMLLRRLIESGQTPVLAIDADPAISLGPLCGIRVETTLGEMRERVRDDAERPAAVAKSDWLALLAEEAICEAKGFDLLTMGYPEGPGCYCFVNNLLRDHLARLSSAYRHVLVDCEAGHEHLSRRTARRPDRLMCVVGRSQLSADTVRRSLALFESLHGSLPPRVELVLNGFNVGDSVIDELAQRAARQPSDFCCRWIVPHDEALAACACLGRSAFDLDLTTPAYAAFEGWEHGL
jgi:CO dehydrogenase nickel-insertion accessory protein CooC1